MGISPSRSVESTFLLSSAIKRPLDLYSGLTLGNSFAPDNILLFRRVHSKAFQPEGVSNNYHHQFELVVVFKKSGVVRVGSHSHLLNPFEAFLVFPNQFHHYLDVDEGELDWLFITFRLGREDQVESLRNRPRVLNDDVLSRIEKIVTLMRLQDSGEDHVLEISFHLHEVLMALCVLPEIAEERLQIQKADDTRDILFEKINEYVRTHIERPMTIGDLAKEFGYSISYLRLLFRDRLGISLGRYIRESRLSHAARLLQGGDLSVTDVSKVSGFESLFAFSRAFKKTYGISPKAYSRMVRSE